jgi:hypothetical protein
MSRANAPSQLGRVALPQLRPVLHPVGPPEMLVTEGRNEKLAAHLQHVIVRV